MKIKSCEATLNKNKDMTDGGQKLKLENPGGREGRFALPQREP